MSDSRLIETFRENERDLVHFLVARLRSVFAAHDLVQELYLKIASLEETSPIRNDRAYLFRMASNLAIDYLRRESRQAEWLAEAQEILGGEVDAASPEETLMARDELLRLERAMAELPPLSRKIFYLSRFEEKSQREIAQIVGISPTGVFNHIRSVMDHLAKVREP